jgi:hypothetical protein
MPVNENPSGDAHSAKVAGPDVVARLDLPAVSADWLRGLGSPFPGLELPDDQLAAEQLAYLGLDEQDQEESLAARPDPDRDPALWWILERTYTALLDNMGCRVPIEGHRGWPIRFGPDGGPVARYLPVWLYLAVLPHVRHYHTARGVPESTSRISLATPLVNVLRKHRSVTGLGGVGLFGFGTSAILAFRGAQYRLGRLEFNRGEISLSDGPCGFALSIHIPPLRGLTPELCALAIAQAEDFFAEHFPEEPVALFTCRSWLLDPQLAQYLPATSNIVQFQRRFHLLPVPRTRDLAPSDGEVAEYVFGRAIGDLETADRETRLQRAFVHHIRAGKHWHDRTGWLAVDRPPAETADEQAR